MSTVFHEPKSQIGTTLAAKYTSGGSSLTVASGYGGNFGDPSEEAPQYVTVFKSAAIDSIGRVTDPSGWALFEITGRSGDVLTAAVVAGYTDQSFPTGSKVYGMLTPEHLTELQAAINALESAPPADSLPDQTGQAGRFLKTDGTDPAWVSVTVADVSGLSSALAGKAAVAHTHAISDVTGLPSALTALSPAGSGSELQYRVDGTTFGAVANTSNQSGKITLGGTATAGAWLDLQNVPLFDYAFRAMTSTGRGLRMAPVNSDSSALLDFIGPSALFRALHHQTAFPTPVRFDGSTITFRASSGAVSPNTGLKEALRLEGDDSYAYVGIGGAAANTTSLLVRPPVNTKSAVVLRRLTGQSANLLEFQSETPSVMSAFKLDGSWKPPAIADSSASNDSMYFSTTAGKLVYKDVSGVVNALY
jgi:hypothetical protein